MKNIHSYINYINEQFNPEWDYVVEMANIGHPVFNNIKYTIATHGTQAGDRKRPHVHIYLNNDQRPFSKFNFEIALDELLCHNELNLLRMKDKSKNIDKTNRNKCNWNGYVKLKDDFEDWLYSSNVDIRGEYINNLDALIYWYKIYWYKIYWYNQESGGDDNSNNPLLNYIKEHGLKILSKFKKYFTKEIISKYKECFEKNL